MANTRPIRMINQILGTLHLAQVSLRRLFLSRQTLISLLLVCFAALAVIAWSIRHGGSTAALIEHVLLPLYVSFLLPIFSLCHASASIASDREEQTLTYVLVTPIPRPMIYLAKYSTALLLALAWSIASLAIICQLGRSAGSEIFWMILPAVFWSTAAYVGLFHLFSVLFRRATIIALAYALFLETFLGNMPGTVKRLSVTFYTHCMIYDRGAQLGLGPVNANLFLPIQGSTALFILMLMSVGLFLLGMRIFSSREYA